MKEDLRWKLWVGISLVALSAILFLVHILIFRDTGNLLNILFEDIAFMPIEVLFVTLIIDSMLEARQKQQRMEKLNMVIGIFFSTLGTPLLTHLSRADPAIRTVLSGPAAGSAGTQAREFQTVRTCLSSHQCHVLPEKTDLAGLRDLLAGHQDFLLRIVENPMVFEHESFTDLILAITHLTEELKSRGDLTDLPPSDLTHLQGDIHRVYSQLVPEWLRYMEYLKTHYPYLFSLALRKNPFDPAASVTVR